MNARLFSCFLIIFASLHAGPAGAASAAGKRYFDMPVREWLGLSAGEKADGIRMLLSLQSREVSQEQVESVAACMSAIGRSPVWEPSTVGTLLTKCSFDMGVAKSPNEAEWDAIVACVKQEVPDFSKEEFYSLALSAAGASLAKDAESSSFMTPRTEKILRIIDRCGGR
jgi:hypothetical protein